MNGYVDDDTDFANPLDYQLAQSQVLKRKVPLASTPTHSVEMPQGAPRTRGPLGPASPPQSAAQDARARSFDALQRAAELAEEKPDVSQYEQMARSRHEAAGGDIQAGMLFQALGGKLSPFGGQVLTQALRTRGESI